VELSLFILFDYVFRKCTFLRDEDFGIISILYPIITIKYDFF